MKKILEYVDKILNQNPGSSLPSPLLEDGPISVGEVILFQEEKNPIIPIRRVLGELLNVKKKQSQLEEARAEFKKAGKEYKEAYLGNPLIKFLSKGENQLKNILEIYATYYVYQLLKKLSTAAIHAYKKELHGLTKTAIEEVLFAFYEKNLGKKLTKSEFKAKIEFKGKLDKQKILNVLKSVFAITDYITHPVYRLLVILAQAGEAEAKVEDKDSPATSPTPHQKIVNFFDQKKDYQQPFFDQIFSQFQEDPFYKQQISLLPLIEDCEKKLEEFQKNCEGQKRSAKFKTIVINLVIAIQNFFMLEEKNKKREDISDQKILEKDRLLKQLECAQNFFIMAPGYEVLNINLIESVLATDQFQLLKLFLEMVKSNFEKSSLCYFVKKLLQQPEPLLESCAALIPDADSKKILANLKALDQLGDQLKAAKKKHIELEGESAFIFSKDWSGIWPYLVFESCIKVLKEIGKWDGIKPKIQEAFEHKSESTKKFSGIKQILAFNSGTEEDQRTKMLAAIGQEDAEVKAIFTLASAFLEKNSVIFCKKLLASIQADDQAQGFKDSSPIQRIFAIAVCSYVFAYWQQIYYVGSLYRSIDSTVSSDDIKNTPGYLGARYIGEYLKATREKQFYPYRLKIFLVIGSGPKPSKSGELKAKAETSLIEYNLESEIEPFIAFQNKQGTFFAYGYYNDKIKQVELSDIKIELGAATDQVNRHLRSAIRRKTGCSKIHLLRLSRLSDTTPKETEFHFHIQELRQMQKRIYPKLLVLYQEGSKYYACCLSKKGDVVHVKLEEDEVFNVTAKNKLHNELVKATEVLEQTTIKFQQATNSFTSATKHASPSEIKQKKDEFEKSRKLCEDATSKFNEIEKKNQPLDGFIFPKDVLIESMAEKLSLEPLSDDEEYAALEAVLAQQDEKAVRAINQAFDCLTEEQHHDILKEFTKEGDEHIAKKLNPANRRRSTGMIPNFSSLGKKLSFLSPKSRTASDPFGGGKSPEYSK